MSYIYDGFFPEFNYIHPFQILIFSPLLLPTDYKLHIQGIFFSRKKGDHTRQTEKTQGKEKEEKKLPQKYCQTWCNKVRCHCPNKSSCLSVYATCKSSIPNLGTHQRFFRDPKQRDQSDFVTHYPLIFWKTWCVKSCLLLTKLDRIPSCHTT